MQSPMHVLVSPLLAVIAIVLPACSNQTHEPGVAAPAKAASMSMDANNPQDEDCVSELPFSRGKTFCSLDEYLAHLEAMGAIDFPWWREISPGVYEHVTRIPGAEREIATREELMERFGFKR